MMDFGSVTPGSNPGEGNFFFNNFITNVSNYSGKRQSTVKMQPKLAKKWPKINRKNNLCNRKKYKNFETRNTPFLK